MSNSSQLESQVLTASMWHLYDQIRPNFQYEVQEKIGAGNAPVYRVRCVGTDQEMAMKKVPFFPFSFTGQGSPEEISSVFRNSAERFLTVARLNHPNIVQHVAMELLLDDERGPHLAIFMEYCSGGTLFHKSQKANGLDVLQVKRYAWQFIQGLTYLHANGICHLDIKGENILLTSDNTVKICDFGEIVQLESASQTQPGEVPSGVGTFLYMAPEMIDVSGSLAWPGRAADIFSFGCVIVEMITGRMPRYHNGARYLEEIPSITYYIGRGGLPEMAGLKATSNDLYLLVGQCLQKNPKLRPTVRQIIRHPALRWNEELVVGLLEDSELRDVVEMGQFRQSNLYRDDQAYCVHSVRLGTDRDTMSAFLDELNVLVQIGRTEDHDNIVQFFGASLIGPSVHLVLERFTLGNLSTFLTNFSIYHNKVLPGEIDFPVDRCKLTTQSALLALYNGTKTAKGLGILTLLGIAYQICSAMEYLTTNSVAFLNLSLENVFFSDSLISKLGNFEAAVEIRPGIEPAFKQRFFPAPPEFHAPEFRNFEPPGFDTDVWSFGAFLFLLFRLGDKGDHGWQDSMETSESGFVEPVFSCTSKEWIFPSVISDMISKCLNLNRKTRPTFKILLKRFRKIHVTRHYVYPRWNSQDKTLVMRYVRIPFRVPLAMI